MGVQQRKERERALRRETFIDTAQRLFFDQGFEQTTMDRIAREAEFSKRTLYLYFQDKWDLFLAVTARGLKIQTEGLDELDLSGTGQDALNLIWRSYFKFSMEYPNYFKAVMVFENQFYRYGHQSDQLPPHGKICWELNDHCSEAVHRAISRGLEDGSLSSDLSPVQLTLLMWSQTAGVIQTIHNRRALLAECYDTTPEALFEAHLQAMYRGAGT